MRLVREQGREAAAAGEESASLCATEGEPGEAEAIDGYADYGAATN